MEGLEITWPFPSEWVRQCVRCWHYWNPRERLRKDGTPRTTCPKCGSYLTYNTRLYPTQIIIKEDLLMLTYGEYPRRYCPRTTLEEMKIPPWCVVAKKGKVRIFVSRGWTNPLYGHYVYLVDGRKGWMTTQEEEDELMEKAVEKCPPNAKVFIGGLGLGLVLLHLARSGKAKEVIVAEINKDIIELVEPRLRWWFKKHYPEFNSRLRIVHGDALELVGKFGKFDWIFQDLWESASSSAKPLVEKAREVSIPYLTERGVLTCWAEERICRQRQFSG